ncbi:MAG: SDR family oxidoreductase [Dehalococcoidia bacterium]|nr:MAG: SDR family oxidoreductase [Dehalococcoidia bacterium]UCG82892.1 MAG: SDR family oxidoreductase [Dehalococcoidia bacterium]
MKTLQTLSELVSLKGKKALITGSAAGIGKAMAYRFAEAGAILELVDMNREGLKTVKKELSQLAPEINIHKVDISKKEQIDALWEHLEGEEPDILVNNAGVFPFKNFLDVDDAFLKKVMDINLNSAFWMCHHMIGTRLKKGGVIINVGSIEAILPFEKELSVYNVSKIGVIGLTRALAKEFGNNGFRINVIIPGGIITPGTKAVAKEITQLKLGLIKTGLEFKTRLPINRGGQPDEVARMALVLASDLSSYVHGALIPVDGGFLSA